MQVNYARFIDRMIQRYEGGYGWDRADPGGPTKYGITCFDLAEHRGQSMTSMAAWADIVRAMPLQEAEDIYAKKYAARLGFDRLRSGPDVCVLDYGVNSGIGRPIVVARKLVNCPGNNGVMDQKLIDAINAVNPVQFVEAMCAERLRFMHAIRGGSAWASFGGGWQKRVDDLRAYCRAIAVKADATVAPAPDLSKVSTPKATNVGQQTSGTVISTGTIGTAATAVASGVPWYGVVGVVLAVLIGGALYEIWQTAKANKANQLVHA